MALFILCYLGVVNGSFICALEGEDATIYKLFASLTKAAKYSVSSLKKFQVHAIP